MSQTTRCIITRNVMGFNDQMEIEPAAYAAVVQARKALIAALALEEKFAMIVANFAEYERTIFDLTHSRPG